MSEMPQLQENAAIMRAQDIPQELRVDYWQALEKADTLKYRWSDMKEPNTARIMKRIGIEQSYFVLDVKKLKIIAEFALESFTGKAAQIHFSMNPENTTALSLNLATCVTDKILNEWQNEFAAPYLECIFGLTAVDNRVALSFIKKVGFRKIGILPSGAKHLNRVIDAVLSIKERN